MLEGNTARSPIRYQDYCAMYFALNHLKTNQSFEKIYCEQGKNDFEIWNTDEFIGFQVKTNPANLTAREVNEIFKYYNSKSTTAAKTNRLFFFIFTIQPVKSLGHLFTIIREGYRGVRYGKRIQQFVDTALEDVPVGLFAINFHCFSEQDMQRLVFSIATEVLKEKTGNAGVIEDEVVYNFIARMRDGIDVISCKSNDDERVFSNIDIQNLITVFINTYKKEKLEDGGSRKQKRTVVELPKIPYSRVVTRQITITETLQIRSEDGEGTPIQ